MFGSVTSCLTPSVLFCILNLTIVTIFITSTLKKNNKLSEEPANSPPQLVRVPSLLERVKSIYRTEEPIIHQQKSESLVQEEEESESVVQEEIHVTRSRFDTCVQAPAKIVLKKSSSEKLSMAKPEEEVIPRRPATARETSEDEAVDEKADDFINRFRQQLKLQRLDSILRYREMLNRGQRS